MTFTPPPVPEFPAGYGPVPADFNTWVQNSFGFQTQNVVFRAEQHTTQSLTAGVTTIITYDTIAEDPFGGWSNTSTGSQLAHSWLAPFTGWYEITMSNNLAVSSGNAVECEVLVTNTTTYELGVAFTASSFFSGNNGQVVVALLGGEDFLQFEAQAINLNTTLNGTLGRYSSVEVTFVSQ